MAKSNVVYPDLLCTGPDGERLAIVSKSIPRLPPEKPDWNKDIKDKAEAERLAGGKMFRGLPDRWYESPGPQWRCENGHVSKMYPKSEAYGASLCLKCFTRVVLTFPEDHEKTVDGDCGRRVD